jgi:hypothetical protein
VWCNNNVDATWCTDCRLPSLVSMGPTGGFPNRRVDRARPACPFHDRSRYRCFVTGHPSRVCLSTCSLETFAHEEWSRACVVAANVDRPAQAQACINCGQASRQILQPRIVPPGEPRNGPVHRVRLCREWAGNDHISQCEGLAEPSSSRCVRISIRASSASPQSSMSWYMTRLPVTCGWHSFVRAALHALLQGACPCSRCLDCLLALLALHQT